MSRGQFQPKSQSGKVLRGCRNKESINKVPIIDVDNGKVDFVTIDTAESSHRSSRQFRQSKSKEKSPIDNFINIDDEESNHENEQDGGDDDAVSRTSFHSSSSHHIFDDNDNDECVIFVKEGNTAQEGLSKNAKIGACSRRIYPDLDSACENGMPVGSNFDLSSSESDTSENDKVETGAFESESSDCEIIDDSSGNIREEWQRAASKRRMQDGTQNASEGHATASQSSNEFKNAFCDTFQEKVNVQDDACEPFFCARQFDEESVHFDPTTDNEQGPCCDPDVFMEDLSFRQEEFSFAFTDHNHATPFRAMEEQNSEMPSTRECADVCNEELKQSFFSSDTSELERKHMCRDKEVLGSGDKVQKKSLETSNSVPLLDGTKSGNYPLDSECVDCDSQKENSLMGDREKHKESEEYRRAAEEEWAARQEQLRIQAEEVHRLRKRKKAESLRLLDMERRQKQRLEEVRESQKKIEETINLKEQFRLEVRKQLDQMELQYKDMASLLRGLGIQIGGGRFPLPHEVNAGYKQALLRFHPDRASRTDIRQQVEAEEKFKLISRLKEKLLPAAR